MSATRYLITFGLTNAGKWLTMATLMSGSVGATSLNVPIFHLFFALAAFWAAALLVAIWLRPRLELDGGLAGPCTAGERLSVRYRLTNTGRRHARDLGVHHFDAPWTPECTPLPHLAPGGAGEIEVAFQAVRRGLYGPLRVRAYSSFPLDLFRFAAPASRRESLLVYPKFTSLESLDIDVGRKFQPGGIALTSNTGESPEYIGNREYRAGDPIRRIDFKAWARLAKPAVREYQEEYFCRVALVIDTYLPGKGPTPPEGHPALEAAISLCAAIADRLALGEHIIDLFAAGPELYVFRAGRQTAHFENVLEILACIDPTRKNPFDVVTPALADELSNVTTLICILLDWDEARQDLVRTALNSGCAVKAFLVRDGAPALPLDQAELDIVHLDPASIYAGNVVAL